MQRLRWSIVQPSRVFVGVTLVSLASLAACASSSRGSANTSAVSDTGPLTVYSGQHPQTVEALVKGFEAQTGAKVRIRSAGEGDLANQLLQEGSAARADVFFAANPPALTVLSAKKLLARVDPSTLAAVPADVSSAAADWVGVSARSAALIYNTQLVNEVDLPASVIDLANPLWKGKLAFAPSETDFQPIVTAVAKLKGAAAAMDWLKGLKSNATIYNDNEAVTAAVNRGERAVGLVDHYYWFRARDEAGGSVPSALHYFSNGDPGALIQISGVAVLASSKHPGLAQAFLAYLVSTPAQTLIASSNSYEYPLVPGVGANPALHKFSNLTPSPLTAAELGDGHAALEMLQQAGLL